MNDTSRRFFHAICVALLALMTLVCGRAQGQSVTLGWNASPGNNVAGYMVYYGQTETNLDYEMDAGNNLTAMVTNIGAGITYYFEVAAYDSNYDLSMPSAPVSYTIPVQTLTILVSANPTSAGTVSGGGVYASGTSVTLTATAQAGYVFANWTDVNGKLVSASPSFTLTATNSGDYTANFSPVTVTYSVTDGAGNNGSLSPVGSQTVTAGSSETFTATPNSGYQVSQWLVNGVVAQTGGTSFTLANITGNDYVQVTFTSEPTVAVSVNPANAGSVTGAGAYAAGSSVTVTATANSGYTFTNWTANGVVQSASPSYSFTLSGNKTLVANFTANPITYTITPSAGNNGSLNPASAVPVTSGNSVTFTATPNSGYQVNQWLVGGTVAQTGGATFILQNVSSNTTVSVTFSAIPTIAVSANPANAGSVSGAGSFAAGTSVTVTATANSGYTFTNWTANGVVQSSSANYTFTVSANQNLVANFVAIPVYYTVAANAGNNGSVSPTAAQSVVAGGAVTFTATPNSGYQVSQWVVAGALAQSGGATFTLKNVSSNSAVGVIFAPEPTVSAAANPAAGGAVTGGGSYATGSSVTIRATANSGYTFTNWTVNGVVQSGSSSYTLTVSTNESVVANFTLNPVYYTVAANAGNNGSVSPAAAQSVLAGNSVTFTATPASGYQVNQWAVNGAVAQTGGATFTVQGVTSNSTVSVTFSSEPTVAVAAKPSNGGTVTGAGAYATGASVTVTAAAGSGYTFTNWTLNGAVQSASATYTFTLNSSESLVANFTANPVYYTVSASAGNNGSVTPTASQSILSGSSATFTATAAGGYQVNQWLVGGVVAQTGGSTFTLQGISSNSVVSVTFTTEPTVAATANPSNGGTVTGAGAYATGASVTVKATANNGYTFTNWTENGVVQSATPSYGFTVSANRNLIANFTLNPVYYIVTASAGNHGSVSPTASQSILSGNSVTYTATAAAGYQVNQWLVGGVVAQTGGSTFTLQSVSSNSTVSVTFSAEPTVAVTSSPANGGTVTGAGAYATGASVTVTATAASGYTFTNWTLNGVVQSASPSYTFTLNSSENLVANFTANPVYYTVSASAGNNGSVSPSGSQSVLSASSVTFTAAPASGYQINQWLVGGVVAQTGGSSFTLQSVSANTSVSVTFSAEPTVAVTANPSNGGTVTGAGAYATGSSVTVTAMSNSGYTFTNWTVNGVVQSASASYTFTLNSSKGLVANFTANPVYYTVSASAGNNGSVSPTAAQSVLSGNAVTFTATPASGYQISQWTVNGVVEQTGGSTFTLQNVSANSSIVVTFASEPTVSVVASPAVGGTVSGGGVYASGSSVTVSAVASSGYTFSNWTANGVVQSASAIYTFNVSASETLVANFSLNPVYYIVIANAGANGAINPAGSQSVLSNSAVTFTASAAAGYQIDQWLVGGEVMQTGGATFKLQGVSANTSVLVTFSAEPTVAVAASPAGAGSVTGAGAYATGSSVTVNATAYNGFTFTNWTENGVVQSFSPNYTFAISANRNLVANFTANPVYYTVTAGAGPHGAINPSGPQTILSNSAVSFVAAPVGGYQVSQWLVNGAAVQNGGLNFMITNINANTAVAVTFTAEPVVAVAASPVNGGNVSGAGAYTTGSAVTVTAAANAGFSFTNWTENGVVQSFSPSYSFNIESSRNLVANFTANPVYYTVTAAAGANGSVSPSTAQSILEGSSVIFTATPLAGYQISQWLVNGVVVQTGGATYTALNIQTNISVSVSFSANPTVAVVASPASAGIVTGSGSYTVGSTVTATAVANSGYTFANWSENGVVQSTSPNYTFTVTASLTMVANFTLNPVYYTVSANAGANGTVNPAVAPSVLSGGSVTFTATPASGYQVNQWLIGGAVVQPGGLTYTFFDVTSNATIAVNFSALASTNVMTNFAVVAKGKGVITGIPAGRNFRAGRKYSLVATASKGFLFADWTSNGIVVATKPTVSLFAESNVLLQANFVTNPFIPVDGVYYGLFYDTNGIAQESSGSIITTLGASGAYSVSLKIGGLAYGHSGVFALDGSTSFTVPRGKLPALTVDLQLNLDGGQLTGTVASESWNSTVVAQTSAYLPGTYVPEAGQYTMIISDSQADGPAGTGFAVVTVSPLGNVTLSGLLGDGSPFSASSMVGANGEFPLNLSLAGGLETVIGWLSFSNNGTIGGNVAWFKDANPRAAYPNGFASVGTVIGSAYHVFPRLAPFNILGDTISLGGGALSTSFSVLTGQAAEIQGIPAPYDRLTYSPGNGIFRSLVMDPISNQAISVIGIVLQDQNYGAGLFISGGQTGNVVLTPGQ